MLDLTKIAQQMQGMNQHMTQQVEAAKKRIEIAEALLAAATPNPTKIQLLKLSQFTQDFSHWLL